MTNNLELNCSSCANVIPLGSFFCNYCGVKINKTSPTQLVPFRRKEKWGFANADTKEIVLDPQYNLTFPKTSPFYEVAVQLNEYHILDNDFKFICSSISRLKSSDEVWIVEIKKGQFNVLNRNGHLLFEKCFDEIYGFNEGISLVKQDNLFGYIRYDGLIISECMYANANKFSEGIAGVVKNNLWGAVDRQGKIIIPCLYEDMGALSEGLIRVKKNGLWGFINTVGELLINFSFYDVNDFNNGLALFSIEDTYPEWEITGEDENGDFIYDVGERNCDLYGYIDKTGNIVVRPDYYELTDMGNGLIRFNNYPPNYPCEDVKFGLLNYKGDKIADDNYYSIGEFNNGFANVYSDENGSNFMDVNGQLLLKEKMYAQARFSEGLALVSNDFQKFGFINIAGEIAVPIIYDGANSFVNGYSRIEVNNKFGFVNKFGALVVPPVYEWLKDFSGGLACFLKDKLYGFINENNQVVIQAKYETPGDFSDDLVGVEFLYVDTCIHFENEGLEHLADLTAEEEEELSISYYCETCLKETIWNYSFGYLDGTGFEYWKND